MFPQERHQRLCQTLVSVDVLVYSQSTLENVFEVALGEIAMYINTLSSYLALLVFLTLSGN